MYNKNCIYFRSNLELFKDKRLVKKNNIKTMNINMKSKRTKFRRDIEKF